MVSLAQLVRASDCGSEGRGFDPHTSPKQNDRTSFEAQSFSICDCLVCLFYHYARAAKHINLKLIHDLDDSANGLNRCSAIVYHRRIGCD